MSRRKILITAMGTRGDLQPFIALGLHLQSRGWEVVLAGPPEFCQTVAGFGLQHEDIGISLQHAINCSPQGKSLRTAGMMSAFGATKDFFRLPLLESWFQACRRLLLQLRPDVLLLTTFISMSGAAALPDLLGLPTRVCMAHTIPMHPTAEFGVPLAGTGFSAPARWLNKLQWESLDWAVSQTLHLPRAQRIVDSAAAELAGAPSAALAAAGCDGSACHGGTGRGGCCSSSTGCSSGSNNPTAGGRIKLQRTLCPGPVPTLHIYSPSLLPKPADWPENVHVVGALLLRRQQVAGVQQQQQQQPQAPSSPDDGLPGSPAHATLYSGGDGSWNVEEGAAGSPGGWTSPMQSSGGSSPGSPGSPGSFSPCSPTRLLSPAMDGVGLPGFLQSYLDAAARQQLPVVYIGLGSMLGTAFEPAEVRRLLGCMTAAVTQLAARLPLCAVIHTTLSAGRTAKLLMQQASSGAATPPPPAQPQGLLAAALERQPLAARQQQQQQVESPRHQLAPLPQATITDGGLPTYLLLDQSVPHELLLPQCALIVHHGGAGTTQAALLAGKPSLVVPCVPSSDQPFWADLVHRRGLGPAWFPVHQLTAARLAAGIEQGLRHLEQYTARAEELAYHMAQEDGVATAAAIIEACVQ